MNMAILIGNVGQDPDIRNTQGGSKVANFSLATTERWKSKEGERKEHTEWHRIVVWGNLADVVENYVSKGLKVAVTGKIKTRKWTDQAGVDRYSTEVVLDGFDAKLELLSSKKDDEDKDSSGYGSGGNSGGYGGGNNNSGGGSSDLDDDIPF